MMHDFIRKIVPQFFKRAIYINFIKRRTANIQFGKKAYADLNTTFEGNNAILDYSSISKSEVGFGSYIAGHTGLSRVKVGRYCSIGQNVKNNFGVHPTDQISTHPAFYSTKKQAGFTYSKEDKIHEHKYADKKNKFLNIIGNDVWIGNNVSLMDGITIGDGAIIGFGAVVTKDIEPYTIVGGVPAKKIRNRFPKDTVNKLLNFRWWEKEEKWIQNHAHLFENEHEFMTYISEDEIKY